MEERYSLMLSVIEKLRDEWRDGEADSLQLKLDHLVRMENHREGVPDRDISKGGGSAVGVSSMWYSSDTSRKNSLRGSNKFKITDKGDMTNGHSVT